MLNLTNYFFLLNKKLKQRNKLNMSDEKKVCVWENIQDFAINFKTKSVYIQNLSCKKFC